MEKNKATRYMPTQKKKEFQPPIAESVDFGFMDIKLVFQIRIPLPVVRSLPKYTTNRDCKA